VGVERDPFSFVSTIVKLLKRKSSGALNSPTNGGRSVGIVRLRTKAAEFVHLYNLF
jgi:hypothetical protein